MSDTPPPLLRRRARALEPPSIKELERALDDLVTVLVQHRRSYVPRGRRSRAPGTTVADLQATDDAVLEAIEIADDAVNYAIKEAMHRVGQLLFDRLGSTDALGEVAERVAERGDWNQRICPIASAFNGVGNDDDFWCS